MEATPIYPRRNLWAAARDFEWNFPVTSYLGAGVGNRMHAVKRP